MEVYFEGEFEYNEVNVKEVHRYYAFRALPNSGLLVFAVFLLCIQIWLISDVGIDMTQLGTLLIILSIPLIIIFKYIRSVNVLLARNRETYGEQMVKMYMSVSEDAIFLKSSVGVEGRVEFSSVNRVVLTKNLIILRTKAKQHVTFHKDHFAKGTSEEFVAFLKSKGLKVKT